MVEIEFDPAKDAINREKHGIGLAAAVLILSDRHIRQKSLAHRAPEDRWIATGVIEGRVMTCVYTMRAGFYRVISLRAARAKERRAYEQAFNPK